MYPEPLIETFALNLTAREKWLLAALAAAEGATMSGLLRRLIREAAGAPPPLVPWPPGLSLRPFPGARDGDAEGPR